VDAIEMEAHIQKLQSLVEAQQAQLQRLLELSGRPAAEHRGDPPVRAGRKRLSRKGLLKAAAMGAVGIAGAELAGSLTPSSAGATGGGLTPDYVNVTGPSGYGVLADAVANGNVEFGTGVVGKGANYGVDGESERVGVQGYSNTGFGVFGITATSMYVGSAGVGGENQGTGANGYGVYGKHYGSGIGVAGTSALGTGVQGSTSGSNAVGVKGVSSAGDGVYGRADGAGKFGVEGYNSNASGGSGVYGSSAGNGYGVRGYGATGVYGQSSTSGGYALSGNNSGSGIGVKAVSTNGLGASFSGGRAPLLLQPAGFAGAPSSGAHSRGELMVDNTGVLYICTLDGTPGTWMKVGTQT
jgi:hypothetical protein